MLFFHIYCENCSKINHVLEGGQVNNLLRVLELREEKVKATEVAVVFNACETLVKRVVRSEDPHLGTAKNSCLYFHYFKLRGYWNGR